MASVSIFGSTKLLSNGYPSRCSALLTLAVQLFSLYPFVQQSYTGLHGHRLIVNTDGWLTASGNEGDPANLHNNDQLAAVILDNELFAQRNTDLFTIWLIEKRAAHVGYIQP